MVRQLAISAVGAEELPPSLAIIVTSIAAVTGVTDVAGCVRGIRHRCLGFQYRHLCCQGL